MEKKPNKRKCKHKDGLYVGGICKNCGKDLITPTETVEEEYHCDCPTMSKCCDELNELKTKYPLMSSDATPSTPPSWEEELWKKSSQLISTDQNGKIIKEVWDNGLVKFISSLISKERAEAYDKGFNTGCREQNKALVEKVVQMKLSNGVTATKKIAFAHQDKSYQQALQDLLDHLNSNERN